MRIVPLTKPSFALSHMFFAALAFAVFALGIQDTKAQERFSTQTGEIIVETVAAGLDHPWGLAMLPGGGMIVTERPGTVRYVSGDGGVSPPLAGGPQTESWGQGGLLDVVAAPDFAQSGKLFFSYAAIDGRRAGTAIGSATLDLSGATPSLTDFSEIFRMHPLTNGTRHFGSRIVFADDGTLWFTIGDRGEPDRAQDGMDHAGGVLRINQDGSIPADNPFIGDPAVDDAFWSIGHRNPQGAALNPATRELWTIEHGARGGDEINIPQARLNYGWPVISYGVEYSGRKIGEGAEKSGLEQPIYYWDPSIAPSGAAFYTGALFPEWQGNLFVGALKDRKLVRLTLDGDRVVASEDLLGNLRERIRDVRQGEDGALYLLTDAPEPDGRILKLAPAR